MSRVVSFPSDRTPVRAAVMELVGQQRAAAASEPQLGPDEAEFLAALRRIVAQAPALDLWDRYRGADADAASRVFARFAD